MKPQLLQKKTAGGILGSAYWPSRRAFRILQTAGACHARVHGSECAHL
ncbi:hypothetical protein ABWK31_10935 [Bacillus sp. JJ353]